MKSLLKITGVILLELFLQTCNKTKLPEVTTTDISEIALTSAASGGEVTNNGGDDVTSRGVCWSTTQNPSISTDTTINGSGNGPFKSKITRLTANTTYYVRAYATNSKGVGYGNEVSFKTGTVLGATLTTTVISSITNSTAVSGGNISDDGGSSITARGVCWNTNPNPTTTNIITTDGTGTGSFTSTLENLMSGTTFYLRAYATNNAGTVYGNELTFTTLCTAPVATTKDASNLGSATATLNATVNASSSSAAVTFEYGLTTAYGTSITAIQSPVTGTTNTDVSAGITGLVQSSVYHYRVKAVNCGGTINGGDKTFQTTCLALAPGIGTITQPTCTVVTGSVVLNDLPATGTWTITRTPGKITKTGTGTSTSITGLLSGTYTFTVTNSSGCVSEVSGDVVINTQPTTPGIPVVGDITEPNCMLTKGSIALNGLPSTGTWTLITNPGATRTTGTGANTIIEGLSIGPVYTFSVINSEGCGSPISIPVSIFIPLPSAVTNLQTISSVPVTVTLNGSVKGNGSSTVVTFEYGTTTSYGSEITATESPVTGNSSVSAVVPNIFLLTEYHFRVKATNCSGTTYGDDLTFTTPGPFGF